MASKRLLDDQEADHEGRQGHHDGTPEALPKAAENGLTGPPGPPILPAVLTKQTVRSSGGSMSLVRVLCRVWSATWSGRTRRRNGRPGRCSVTSLASPAGGQYHVCVQSPPPNSR